MRFTTGTILLFATCALAAPAAPAEKYASEDLSRFLEDLTNCEKCTLGRTHHDQLLIVDPEGNVQKVMNLDEADADAVDEISKSMELDFGKVYPILENNEFDSIGEKNLEEHRITISPVFGSLEQRDDEDDDDPPSQGPPKAPCDDDLVKRQINISPISRPFEYTGNAVEATNTETTSPQARHENPTKNARPFDQTSSYISRPEDAPTTLSKRQRQIPSSSATLTRPNTLEKREVPPGTDLSNIAEPTSTAPTDGPTPTYLPSDDEEEGEKMRCAIPRKCTTSATCRGMCDACTYVGWYPYGLCMGRESGRGRIVD